MVEECEALDLSAIYLAAINAVRGIADEGRLSRRTPIPPIERGRGAPRAEHEDPQTDAHFPEETRFPRCDTSPRGRIADRGCHGGCHRDEGPHQGVGGGDQPRLAQPPPSPVSSGGSTAGDSESSAES